MEKVRIAAVSDIPRGEGKSFSVKGKTFAVFNVDGRFYALGNVCPHRGGSLGDGFLQGNTITCPMHSWEFDVRTGECIAPGAGGVPTYEIEVDGHNLFVHL